MVSQGLRWMPTSLKDCSQTQPRATPLGAVSSDYFTLKGDATFDSLRGGIRARQNPESTTLGYGGSGG